MLSCGDKELPQVSLSLYLECWVLRCRAMPISHHETPMSIANEKTAFIYALHHWSKFRCICNNLCNIFINNQIHSECISDESMQWISLIHQIHSDELMKSIDLYGLMHCKYLYICIYWWLIFHCFMYCIIWCRILMNICVHLSFDQWCNA